MGQVCEAVQGIGAFVLIKQPAALLPQQAHLLGEAAALRHIVRAAQDLLGMQPGKHQILPVQLGDLPVNFMDFPLRPTMCGSQPFQLCDGGFQDIAAQQPQFVDHVDKGGFHVRFRDAPGIAVVGILLVCVAFPIPDAAHNGQCVDVAAGTADFPGERISYRRRVFFIVELRWY